MFVACTISAQKIKGQGNRGYAEFLVCLLRGSVPIWLVCFILYTNIVHGGTMCRDQFPRQKVKG